MFAQVDSNIADSRLVTTQDIGALIIPAIIIAILVLLIVVINYFLIAYFKKRKVKQDWIDLDPLIEHFDLTREEKSFLKNQLKKLGYRNPTAVFKKKPEYQRLTARILKRPNHHAEFLLKVIEKKIFSNQKIRPKTDSRPIKVSTTTDGSAQS